jgi:hypothetical protein
MSRQVLVAIFLVAAGCQTRDGVVLTVRAEDLVADQLSISATYGGRTVTHLRPDVAAGALAFPEDLFADFGGKAVDVIFTVDALDHGQPVAHAAMPSLHVGASQLLAADVALVPLAPTAPPPPPPPDLGPSYASVVLADAPLAYYRLDEPADVTIAHDSSGNGLHGTYGAQVTRGVSGLLSGDGDGAARFNGGNWSLAGVVAVPPSPLLQPSAAISIELWLSSLANSPDFTTLIDYGDSDTVNHQPPYGTIIFQGALATLLFTDQGSIGSSSFVTTTLPAPQRSYHYVQTYDGVSAKLYVNGVLEAQAPNSGAISGYGLSGLGIGGAAAGTSGLIFAGTLDEVALYGVALTPQQVLAHYRAGARR